MTTITLKDLPDLSNSLRQDDFFLILGQELQKTLLKAMTSKSYKVGDVLIKEGEPQTKMFIIVSGKVEKKKGWKTTVLARGEISGLLHFFQQDPSYGTLTVAEEAVVLEIDNESFRSLVADHPALNNAVIAFLSKQLRTRSHVINEIRAKIGGEGAGIRVAFFDSKGYMREAFEESNGKYKFEITWFKDRLSPATVEAAWGYQVVCCFVNDVISTEVVEKLAELGVQLIAMRCAGYDNLDLKTATKLGLSVTRVPAYSPYAVAEHAIALVMSLNRKIYKAVNRTRDHNFSLNGLVGFDMYGKTFGVIGTGKIGKCLVNIARGFGCNVLCFDVYEDAALKATPGVKYVSKDELLANSDVISLHAPLLPSTHHTINAESLSKMKKTALLVNTSRGGLVDSSALLDALENNRIAGAALDVYEGEKGYFFEDRSEANINDSVLTRLLSCHNLIITSHQAFLTHEALGAIADSTLSSIKEFAGGKKLGDLTNAVKDEYK